MDLKLQVLKNILGSKLNIFFHPTEGITRSEANHLANVVKHNNEILYAGLARSGAAIVEVNIDGNNHTISNPDKLNPEDLYTIGKNFGFSAWLREAIKFGDDGLAKLRSASLDQFIVADEDKVPEFSDLIPPLIKRIPRVLNLNENPNPADYLDIGELADYFYVESMSAHIGKAIHGKEGFINKIREETFKKEEFARFRLNDKEYLANKTYMYSDEDINKLFMNLQAQHRNYEQKVNFYKAKIKNLASQEFVKASNEYKLASDIATQEYDAAMNAYQTERARRDNILNRWHTEMSNRKTQAVQYFSAFKVVIPNIFRSDYESLTK